jgi:hypothetical protein
VPGALVEIVCDAMNNRILRDDIDVETVLDCIVGAPTFRARPQRVGGAGVVRAGAADHTPALKP